MEKHLYLVAYRVEALVASMLPPEHFGTYMATGTQKLSHDKLLFFEIAPDISSDYFDMGLIDSHLVPHEDGTPKRSVYISIYRVLEHLDLSVFRDLCCVTRDGRVLRLEAREYEPGEKSGLRLYQELIPVSPLIASDLPPRRFGGFVTDRSRPVSVPRILFADLMIREHGAGDAGEILPSSLPYAHPEHIRACLEEFGVEKDKHTKTVDRSHSDEFFYRTIKDGFFLADSTGLKWYPFPGRQDLEGKYNTWWRSATLG